MINFIRTFFLGLLFTVVTGTRLAAQTPPWKNDLYMAWSADGKNFGPSTVFQDSSGVPSVVRWKGDTLVCAFQWFRLPQNAPSWDRVAVKFSYDGGLSWTAPAPIVMSGMPANYQRPFDPTLAVIGGDSLRIYYSSSEGMPSGGLNATVNTYSARSADGVHYSFESGARVDEPANRVIDPAVLYFNGAWHYTAPIGAPQEGAYHYVSPDGLTFSKQANIPSDNQHNWTGNLMRTQDGQLRFYGSGPQVWYNTSANGGIWNGFVSTNVQGGDPTVVQLAPEQYLMIYVGPANLSAVTAGAEIPEKVWPNPCTDRLELAEWEHGGMCRVYSAAGQLVWSGRLETGSLHMTAFVQGWYLVQWPTADRVVTCRVFKQ